VKFPSTTEIIGAHSVTVTKMPALKSFQLLTKLGKVIGPALLKLQNDVTMDSDIKELAPVVSELLHLGDDPIPLLIEALTSTCVDANGKLVPLNSRDNIDAVFGSDLMSLMLTVAFTLRVQYGDFFGALSDTLPVSARSKREGSTEQSGSLST
jgi:hypothetical protein